jgi:hypothetical protein
MANYSSTLRKRFVKPKAEDDFGEWDMNTGTADQLKQWMQDMARQEQLKNEWGRKYRSDYDFGGFGSGSSKAKAQTPPVVDLTKIHQTPHHVLATPGFWYVATPYTNYPHGREKAYEHASAVLGGLWAAGAKAFSPIAHSRGVEKFCPGADKWDHEFWMETCQPFMDQACGVILVGLDGWTESKGMALENKFFRAVKKPVWFLHPPSWQWTEHFGIPGAREIKSGFVVEV